MAIYAVRERASRESLEGGKRGFGRQANGFGCGMEARQGGEGRRAVDKDGGMPYEVIGRRREEGEH